MDIKLDYSQVRFQENGIQKVPTPITPIKIDKESRHITLAYFEKKSTVDYIGAVQGIPVCFDAKECKTDSFPLANIHEHQVTFMKDFEQQGGISFLLLYFTARDEYYYLRYETMKTFWDRGQNGGKKHFSYTELETSFFLPRTGSSVLVPYLNGIQKDLEIRDSKAD